MARFKFNRFEGFDPDELIDWINTLFQDYHIHQAETVNVIVSNYKANALDGMGANEEVINRRSKFLTKVLRGFEAAGKLLSKNLTSDDEPYQARWLRRGKRYEGIVMQEIEQVHNASISIADIIGYESYAEIFLKVFRFIAESPLSQSDKERLCYQVEGEIKTMLDGIGLMDPVIKVSPNAATYIRVALGTLDFPCGDTLFSAILQLHLELMARAYCHAMAHMRLGHFNGNEFITKYFIYSIDIPTGVFILTHMDED